MKDLFLHRIGIEKTKINGHLCSLDKSRYPVSVQLLTLRLMLCDEVKKRYMADRATKAYSLSDIVRANIADYLTESEKKALLNGMVKANEAKLAARGPQRMFGPWPTRHNAMGEHTEVEEDSAAEWAKVSAALSAARLTANQTLRRLDQNMVRAREMPLEVWELRSLDGTLTTADRERRNNRMLRRSNAVDRLRLLAQVEQRVASEQLMHKHPLEVMSTTDWVGLLLPEEKREWQRLVAEARELATGASRVGLRSVSVPSSDQMTPGLEEKRAKQRRYAKAYRERHKSYREQLSLESVLRIEAEAARARGVSRVAQVTTPVQPEPKPEQKHPAPAAPFTPADWAALVSQSLGEET